MCGFPICELTPGAALVICENVGNIVFDDVTVVPRVGPVYDITNGSDITIRKAAASEGTGVFVRVEGSLSKNIELIDCDLSDAARNFTTATEVPKGVVVIR